MDKKTISLSPKLAGGYSNAGFKTEHQEKEEADNSTREVFQNGDLNVTAPHALLPVTITATEPVGRTWENGQLSSESCLNNEDGALAGAIHLELISHTTSFSPSDLACTSHMNTMNFWWNRALNTEPFIPEARTLSPGHCGHLLLSTIRTG
ncbi:hypothetical protein AVEN_12474-1 [Araneus ventricosus]|uniref:Uncharacterized protein n=1 Tax=Araneus ventricosus TaxID=182803 RepID=A0A4Y2ISA2_ARAVE|nr:hypothetical protein AVEN_12474-1 [Araneus ventricosus]